jgi:predicted nucleotidyltransferase
MSIYQPLFKALNDAGVQYVVVGGLATVLHGYPRFTADVDIVINLEKQEAEKAIKTITSLGLQARLPVDPMDFTVESIRESWIEKKNMLVFSFYDPKNTMLIVDVFVREPLPFSELSARAKPIAMNDIVVPVCDIDQLIEIKQKAGRDKDIQDIKYLRGIRDENKRN